MEFDSIKIKDTNIKLIDGDRGKNYPKKTEMMSHGHTLFLNNKNISENFLDDSFGDFITEEKSNLLKKGKLNRNDIVLSTRGSVGNVGFYDSQVKNDNIRINSGMIILRNDDEKFLNEYLYLLFKSPYMQNKFKEFVSGSVQNHLPIRDLQHIKIIYPPLFFQAYIVKIIRQIEEKIQINKKLIANLEELSQTLFKRWFVDFEFPDENGAPYKANGGEMTNSELGEIPKAWRVETLEKLGSIIGGGTPSKKNKEYYTNNGIPWITPKDLSKNRNIYISHGENDISELGLNKSSAKLIEKNSVLFSSRAPIGYIAINNMPVTTNQGFKSIVPNEEMNPYFIYFILKNITPLIEQTASGSTFKEISAKGMKSIKIVFPSIELIKQYGNIVKKYFEEINFLENQNIKLIELRDTLLPKLMSGELEIPDDVEVNTDELSI